MAGRGKGGWFLGCSRRDEIFLAAVSVVEFVVAHLVSEGDFACAPRRDGRSLDTAGCSCIGNIKGIALGTAPPSSSMLWFSHSIF